MLSKLLKPLVILFTISATVSGCLYSDTASFLRYFLIATFIQIIVYNMYSTFINTLHERNEIEQLAELSKQVVETRCPCPKAITQVVPITANEPTAYKCQDCNRGIVAVADVKTFLATEPVDIEQGNNLIEKLYNDAVKNKSHGNTTI